jgi:hypothetical protein
MKTIVGGNLHDEEWANDNERHKPTSSGFCISEVRRKEGRGGRRAMRLRVAIFRAVSAHLPFCRSSFLDSKENLYVHM